MDAIRVLKVKLVNCRRTPQVYSDFGLERIKLRVTMIAKAVLVLCFAGAALGYSGGAPEEVCDDMTPKHPVDPQKSTFPYKVTVDKDTISPGDTVNITISGAKSFKGYLLQVRDGNTPVGTFLINDDNRYSKTINCSGKKVRYANIFEKKMHHFMRHCLYMLNSVASRIVPYDLTRMFFREERRHTAATHKNSASKNNLVLTWAPPKEAKTYTVYATVAEDGGVFWVRKPTAKITVK